VLGLHAQRILGIFPLFAATGCSTRKAICLQNLVKFSQDARAGKLLCLSDLIGQAEQVHIENMEDA